MDDFETAAQWLIRRMQEAIIMMMVVAVIALVLLSMADFEAIRNPYARFGVSHEIVRTVQYEAR